MPQVGPGSCDRLASRRGLIALCVSANVVEAALLAGLGVRAGLTLAPQASAPVPFGVFHDLRWLVVYSDSWASLGAEGLALLVGRSLLTALTVRAAWPRGSAPPPLAVLLARAGAFTLGATVLLAPWTVLLFGLAVAPVSWFFLAAVPAALIVALFFHHGAIAPGWWRQSLAPRALGWVALTFAVLSASADAIAAFPATCAIPVAALAGLFDAWAWHGLVQAVAGRPRAARFRPVAPAGLLGLVSIAVGGTVLSFSLVASPGAAAARLQAAQGRPEPANPGPDLAERSPGSSVQTAAAPVLVASGYGTHWSGAAPPELTGPYLERRFSYAGLGRDGRPLPYVSSDTTRPLVSLEQLMATQVAALYRLAHRPVSIVADSEASLVAEAYLAASPGAPVANLVMISPLVRPARVYYPPAGTPGWGLAGGVGLRGLSLGIQAVTTVPLSPTSPFLRSVVQEAPALRSLLSCPLSRVRQFAFLPLADAVASPGPFPEGVPSVVLPAFHGGMLSNTTAERDIRAVLAGGRPLPTPGWSLADTVIRSAASAWQVPELALPLSPAWALPAGATAPSAKGGDGCRHIRHMLAAQLAAADRSHPGRTAGDRAGAAGVGHGAGG